MNFHLPIPPFSRRRLVQQAAVLTGAAAVTSSQAPAEAVGSPEVEARLANIVRQYGARLSPEQVQRLRKVLGDNERMLAPVRSFAIANGDTPAGVLKLRPESEN